LLRKDDHCEDLRLCPGSVDLDGWTERCQACPVLELERAMTTLAGQVVSRAIEIDADIDCGIAPKIDEIPARVFSAVRMVRLEKQRYQNELQERGRDGRP
jgi:hypothetical protein